MKEWLEIWFSCCNKLSVYSLGNKSVLFYYTHAVWGLKSLIERLHLALRNRLQFHFVRIITKPKLPNTYNLIKIRLVNLLLGNTFLYSALLRSEFTSPNLIDCQHLLCNMYVHCACRQRFTRYLKLQTCNTVYLQVHIKFIYDCPIYLNTTFQYIYTILYCLIRVGCKIIIHVLY